MCASTCEVITKHCTHSVSQLSFHLCELARKSMNSNCWLHHLLPMGSSPVWEVMPVLAPFWLLLWVGKRQHLSPRVALLALEIKMPTSHIPWHRLSLTRLCWGSQYCLLKMAAGPLRVLWLWSRSLCTEPAKRHPVPPSHPGQPHFQGAVPAATSLACSWCCWLQAEPPGSPGAGVDPTTAPPAFIFLVKIGVCSAAALGLAWPELLCAGMALPPSPTAVAKPAGKLQVY